MPKTRVLLIEDQEELGEMFVSWLNKAGLEVDWAKDWKEAQVFMVPTALYAAVFTDNDFPGGDGSKTAKLAKDIWGDIPVMLVSGRASQVREEFLAAGGDKVFEKIEFREALKDVIAYITEAA